MTAFDLEAPVARAVAAQDALYPAPPDTMSPAEIKALFAAQPPQPLPPRPAGVTAEDATLALSGPDRRIAIRTYTPQARGGSPSSRMVHFHGGGFTLGGLDSHDAACAAFANELGIAVTAVNYRKLPEHPFPAAYEDALGAVAAQGDDASALVLAGDSSGANLALAAALALRERGVTARALMLFYPILGLDFETDSYRQNAAAPALTRARCRRIWSDYVGGDLDAVAARGDWRAAPLLATDFSGLPPAVVTVAEHDPLASDGSILVERMNAAGGRATLIVGKGLPHGFLKWRSVSERSAQAIRSTIEAVGGLLAR